MAFLSNCGSRLKHLSCSHLSAATTQSLEPLRESKVLESLNLSYCSHVQKEFFTSLTPQKLKFSSFVVDGIGPIQSEFLQCLENSKSTLKHLSLQSTKFDKTDSKDFKAIADCSNLEYLDFAGVAGLGEECIGVMSGSKLSCSPLDFSKLKHLNMSNLPNIGEYMFAKFAAKCLDLETFILCNNSSLAEATLQNILRSCKELKVVNMNFCSGLDPKVLAEVQLAFPDVKISRLGRKFADPKDDGLRVWLPLKDAKRPDDKKKKKK